MSKEFHPVVFFDRDEETFEKDLRIKMTDLDTDVEPTVREVAPVTTVSPLAPAAAPAGGDSEGDLAGTAATPGNKSNGPAPA